MLFYVTDSHSFRNPKSWILNLCLFQSTASDVFGKSSNHIPSSRWQYLRQVLR
jgi:hypothetical protein